MYNILTTGVFYNYFSIYDGGWVNGLRTGKGKYIKEEGEIYEGDFVEDKWTGNITCNIPSCVSCFILVLIIFVF